MPPNIKLETASANVPAAAVVEASRKPRASASSHSFAPSWPIQQLVKHKRSDSDVDQDGRTELV